MSTVSWIWRKLDDESADSLRGQRWNEVARDRVPSVDKDIVLLERGYLSDKKDAGKVRFNLIDPTHWLWVAEVLTMGGDEYGDDNYKHLPDARVRFSNALERHFNDWRRGTKIDSGSKKNHLVHVIANALFLLYHDDQEPQK